MKWLGACAVAQPTLFAAVAVLCLSQMDANAGAQTMASPGQGGKQTLSVKPAAGPAQGAQGDMLVHSVRTAPDDPAKVAAARQFIIAYHPNMDPKQIAAQVERVLPRMVALIKEEEPKVDVEKFRRERRALLIGNANKTLDLQAHVISRHFTLQELNALTNYFRGGVGKKLANEIPKIQMDLMMERRQQMLMKPVPGMKPQAPAAAPAAPKKGAAPQK